MARKPEIELSVEDLRALMAMPNSADQMRTADEISECVGEMVEATRRRLSTLRAAGLVTKVPPGYGQGGADAFAVTAHGLRRRHAAARAMRNEAKRARSARREAGKIDHDALYVIAFAACFIVLIVCITIAPSCESRARGQTLPAPAPAPGSAPGSAPGVASPALQLSVKFNGSIDLRFSGDVSGAPIATGTWRVDDAAGYVTRGEESVTPGPVRSVTVTATPTGYAIAQRHDSISAVQLLEVSGADLSVTSTISNDDQAKPLRTIGLGGMTLTWPAATPIDDGRINGQHPSYFASRQWAMAFPSDFNMWGAWAWRSDAWSVGVNPLGEHARQSILVSQWASNNLAGTRRPLYLLNDEIAPGASRTVRLVFRFGKTRDFRALAEPYRADFMKFYPRPLSVGDARPIAFAFLTDPKLVSASNPGGFKLRVDTAQGRAEFARQAFEPLGAIDGQACIVWDLSGFLRAPAASGGASGGSLMYSPEFDVMAPGIDSSGLADLVARARAAKVRLGVMARPTSVLVRDELGIATGLRPVNYADTAPGGEVDRVMARFDALFLAGVTDFYVDSTGMTWEHVQLLARARRLAVARGVNALLYTERMSAATLPYANLYTNCYANADSGGGSFRLGPSLTADDLATARWLYPGVACVVQLRDIPADRVPAAIAWIYSLGALPGVPYWDVRARAAVLREQTNLRVDPATNWWR